MNFYDVEQNSEEWLSLKLGKFSASFAGDLFAKKETKAYQNAIIKVAYEIVTGESEENFSNKWMKRGHDKEYQADENYKMMTFNETSNGGIWVLNEYTCASPDKKIVGKNAGTEFKCPSVQIYHEYITNPKKLPKDYFWQVHFQMYCTGWDYIDFMPFSSPRIKQVLLQVERSQSEQDQIAEKLYIAIKEVQELVEVVKA